MYDTIHKEKALLVLVEAEREKWPREIFAEEFKELVVSAGIDVEHLIFVKKYQPTPALYIGKGKVEEIARLVEEKSANVVIFSNNLSFTQQRNLEEAMGVKTIDRTQLILDIFARRAHTQEGILEVELAQLQYLLPRLRGKGIMLSRLGGGIGTRGPGEKKLEVDRRRIAERITRIKKELNDVRQHREVIRKKRQKQEVSLCSLVGYTNAGKSTLFNALTQSNEKTAQTLFTTLDTVTHTCQLNNNLKVIISDTVGFLHRLPPHLVEAFKATLEELHYADLLVHVIDASCVNINRLRESVDSVLEDLGISSKRVLMVFNKIDKMPQDAVKELQDNWPQAVFISALCKLNIDALKKKIYDVIFGDMVEVVLQLPFDRMEALKYIHQNCEVLKTTYQDKTAVYWVKIKRDAIAYLEKQGVSVKDI